MNGDYAARCAELERQATGFVEVVARADLGAPVPTCPGWTMADLVRHHGTSQRRVEHVVRHLSLEPVWARDVATGVVGDDAAWFAAGVPPLLATLRSADPDAEVWTNGRDQHVRYWARRILFEAVVHRADAALAVGLEPEISDSVGVDGVEELLTNLPCFSWVAERQRALDPGRLLRFEAASGQAWTINAVCDPVDGDPAVVVRAAAGDLLLLVYGRIGLEDDRVGVVGDRRFVGEWLAASAL
jgi:uncharacterized protein (TIGR03083 family)